jgi:hypothetical protein
VRISRALGKDVSETCAVSKEIDLRDISRLMNALLREWDCSVEQAGSSSFLGSAFSVDMAIGHRLKWDDNINMATRMVTFFVGSNIGQMVRALSSLFDNADNYPLTFGHLPLARSVYEGVGQIKWILSDDDDLDAPVVVILDAVETERRSRRRTARSVLSMAASWQQAIRDAQYQKDDTMRKDSLARLAELETLAHDVLPIAKSKKGVWTMGDITRPGARAFGEAGWNLAWWPQKIEWHPYGFVSAVSHSNLYHLGESLSPTISGGRPVLRVDSPRSEIYAGGLFVASAFFRVIELLFAYAGWPRERLSDQHSELLRAHTRLQDATEASKS